MGYYINPPDQSKEDFLKEHGTPISRKEALDWDYTSNSLPVCLVDNGFFIAAAICYSKEETEAFSTLSDPRSKIFLSVPKEKLRPYYDAA